MKGRERGREGERAVESGETGLTGVAHLPPVYL